MILIENLSKSFADRLLFSEVNFKVSDGEKLGIVGKNGTGKSTLIKIIIGDEEYDEGTVSGFHSEDLGYAEQIPRFTHKNLIDELMSINDNEFFDGAVKEFEVKKVLFGLGFTETDLVKNPNEFSGGEMAKIALGKALVSEPRILLLDEPTNHLDIYAIDFLENFIKSYRGTVVAVTHDRHFLQNCVDKIVDIENQHATLYAGNYEKFVQLKREHREYQLKAYEKQQEEIAKLEEFVRRNKVRASTAKRARSRQITLDRMERLEKPPTDETIKLNLTDTSETANRVLTIENLNFKNIINDFNLEILKGEKVGLIGRNGVGKSTLLKLIVGDLKSNSGAIKIGNRVKVGYLSQGHEELDNDSTPIEELINEFGITIERARSELARLEIYTDVATKPIASMSGGEKTRVALAKLILTGANFLILDEPTNHLDLPAREAIEAALMEFDGTLLIVTHDRYLLEKITSRVIELNSRVENISTDHSNSVNKNIA
ncbi:MAG: ABC-F family ATP-binding cassette domain-containing protein, partial [Selenomonadaceae bacterium]|nr:ABC-F family ATP-binding cassette domain-containing protein [Selenomonadaceae bacterium]